MIKKIFSLTFMVFLMLACSTMEIHVTSEPSQATVYIKDGKKLKKLGETPLKLNSDSLSDYKNFNLSIQKEGYQPHEVLLEKRAAGAKAEVYANLKKQDSLLGVNNNWDDQEKSQRSLASIQAELIKNDYIQAESLAKAFLSENPYSAVGWNLLGNAYLLQNRNGQALSAYKKALEYDPQNKDTFKMIEFLQGSPQRRER